MSVPAEFASVPVVDVSAALPSLASPSSAAASLPSAVLECAAAIRNACQKVGFFYLTGYSTVIASTLEESLDSLSREFFRLDLEEKDKIHMRNSGKAWRGFFKVGDELTSGKPDVKEGLYLGQQIDDDSPLAGLPVHGKNQFPARPEGLKAAIEGYMAACEELGQKVMALIAVSLGLDLRFFKEGIVKDPLCLFRIFHYPPFATQPEEFRAKDLFSVGAHSDYGLITLLRQDSVGGLEVQNREGKWVPAPPIPNSFVVNVGDMLEALTRGLFRSTLHRVRNPSDTAMRISFPFFFDPGFHAAIAPLPLSAELQEEAKVERERRAAAGDSRWDGRSPLEVEAGTTYGSYLLSKIQKVFPDLAQNSQLLGAPTKS